MLPASLLWAIPFLPLVAFGLIALFAGRSNAWSHGLAIASALLAWGLSAWAIWSATRTPDLAAHPLVSSIAWFPAGSSWFSIGVLLDPLSTVMLFFVSWTILLIFVYSVGYHNYGAPRGDADQPGLPPQGAPQGNGRHKGRVPSVEPLYARFFGWICLFAAAMYLLVLSDNLLLLYVGWEVMGLCSYLLIGFWFQKPSARDAAVKAFLTTRVGDMFMLLGLVALYSQTGSLSYQATILNPQVVATLAAQPSVIGGLSWAGLIALLLFLGTVGKSAQFPLHVWLPDAMEGPTPVSAMIHAATMVSAGIYLLLRFFPLISAGWAPGQGLTLPMAIIAGVGAFTALFAATMAMVQRNIKRVLAYSTISQLGYMVAAVGMGAFSAAAFHLTTHAFFKALLFLAAGSVIHGVQHGALEHGETLDAEDMFAMGGLRKKMPLTFWTFTIGGLALAGLPLVTAGFWSKDAILSAAYEGSVWPVFVVLALAALLTAFYVGRQLRLVFFGEPRSEAAADASESPRTMRAPLAVLAFFAITLGWVGIPGHFPVLGGAVPDLWNGFLGTMTGAAPAEAFSWVPLLTSVVVSLGGLALGWVAYAGVKEGGPDPLSVRLGKFYGVLEHRYYIDDFYSWAFVRPAHWLAETFTVAWVDRTVLDGVLNAIGRFGLVAGRFFRGYVDVPIINGAANGLGAGVRESGKELKRVEVGRVQLYMTLSVTLVVVLAVCLYIFLA